MSKYKSIDLFAGIGGIRLGFDRAFGDDIETVFVSEWDEHAQKTYKANFADDFDIAGDITKIEEKDIPHFDICLAGFPCQAFSMAGNKQGFNDNYKGLCRGTLFLDVARICEYHKPKVIFCENVKGLVIHDKGRTFQVICSTFEELGYKVFSKVLNSKDFGVPQHRERIYIVAFRNDIAPKNFEFPTAADSTKRIRDIIEENPVSSKYYLSDVYMETLRKHKARHEAKGNGFGYEIRDWDSIAGAIVCGGMGRERNLIIDKRQTDLTPVTHIKGDINDEGIRKMTPREWARLQGFPDTYKLPLADVHLYKQFGNSVTVNVIEAIAQQIKNTLEGESAMIIGSKNKGDWSELYVLLYLLGTRKLYTADEALKKSDEFYFPIKKVIRNDTAESHVEFSLEGINRVEIYLNSELTRSMTSEDFKSEASALFKDIVAGAGSFDIPHAERFLNAIFLNRLAAPSSDITDIKMELHDTLTGIDQIMGFSVKSYIGGAPTLLNASGATNFAYEVIGLNDEQSEFVNSIETRTKIIDRIKAIEDFGGTIKFSHAVNDVFSGNLIMIDSMMEDIIADMLLYSYTHNEVDCEKLVDWLETSNPLGYSRGNVYTYKFKQFLCAKALGMDPSEKWSGIDEANGGYIVAKSDGEVLAYHIYNRDKFMQYLLSSTKFERASTKRHGFASIYTNGGKKYINLNLQIRFK